MNPWLAPGVAEKQRALADEQLQQSPLPIQFRALAEAVRFTNCPGEVWEVGCASGYNREALDRQGVLYRSYGGNDVSPAAVMVARERYPESTWFAGPLHSYRPQYVGILADADIVIDGCALMHADDWKAHLADLCARSRRWVILHRVPLASETKPAETSGYGQTFGAWMIGAIDIMREMRQRSFPLQSSVTADGDSETLTFAKPRIYATYCDSNYLGRLKSLHASMLRHCGPFELHVLAWDAAVLKWAETAMGVKCLDAETLVIAGDLESLPGPKRTLVELMWTAGPAWIAAVMDETKQPVTYVDADIMFHSSPEPVFAEIGGAPAAVFPHGFARLSQGLPGPTVESHEVFGKYNVGLVYIADRTIAEEWAAQCREWCYDRVEDFGKLPTAEGFFTQVPIVDRARRYGDQKYLDDWPVKHAAHIVQHPGAELGPWAVHTRALDVRDGVIHFGNRPLVAFHYSSYLELPEGRLQYTRPEYRLTARQQDIIYGPYVKEMERQKR